MSVSGVVQHVRSRCPLRVVEFGPQPDTRLHCETMHGYGVSVLCGVPVSAFAGTRYTRRDGQAELIRVAGGWLHTEMVYPSADGHPSSTNRAQRRVTSLIETNALPLSQTDVILTQVRLSKIVEIISFCGK